jgi:hypothetical protein
LAADASDWVATCTSKNFCRAFRLADGVRYIQRRAAEHDGRIAAVGQLVLFSTATGDA